MSITARLRSYQMLAIIGLGSMVANPAVEADDSFRRSAQQINEANAALANEEFETAISGYEAAAQSVRTRDEAIYNKAIALYRQGEVEQAGNLFASVAASLKDELAAKARFNAGNCHFAAAIEMQQTQPAIAIEHLHAAIEDYRSALSLAPTDKDARVNIELAAKMLKQFNRQPEQQQQTDAPSSGDDGPEPKSPDQSEQTSDQNGADEQAAKQQDSEQQNPEQQDADQDSSAQQADDQQTAEQQTAEQQNAEQQNADQGTSGEQPNADQSSPSEQDAESQRNEQNANREAESPAPNTQQPRSSSEKSEPAVRPNASNQQESGQAEDQQPVSDPAPADRPNVTGELSATNESMKDAESNQNTVALGESEGVMTEQEARKMLQAIRDRDMVRRLRRQAAERSRRIPVAKDW